MHGCSVLGRDEVSMLVPAGRRLSRARIRHLAQSERIPVSDGASSAGLAAYRKADSDVRVVHEFLVSRRLDDRGARAVAHMMLTALEMLSCDDGVRCLMFLLGPDVSLTIFDEHAYTTLVTDSNGAWLQKKLDIPWMTVASHRLH
jgi:hypothetical protein